MLAINQTVKVGLCMGCKFVLIMLVLLVSFVDGNALTFTGQNKSMLQGLHAKKNIMPLGV